MYHQNKKYTLILCCLVSYIVLAQEENRETKQHPELSKLVKIWAQKLGRELRDLGELVTRRDMVIDSFKDTTVTRESGEAILKDIHENVAHMMHQKVEAIKRIMDTAEAKAQEQKEEDLDFDFQFYNMKNLTDSSLNITETKSHTVDLQELRYDDSFISAVKQYENMIQPEEEMVGYQQDQDQTEDSKGFEDFGSEIEVVDDSERDPQASQIPQIDKSKLPLFQNHHFYNIPVNTNYSAVHVPSNVYERSKEVISGIKWSEELDKMFRYNYKLDPSLSWQYFGSSTGFMRQFPAMIWSQEPIDLFDCRTRSWYIEAASSPKDVVILVDRSGSMTGMRREIARHVVHNILDTLGNNDYVNIYSFTNTTDPLVECFNDTLVQANLANIRILKEAMSNFKTEQIADLSLALTTAFELLQSYRQSGEGANCSQAVMLITDGVHYNYKEIFEKYNWQNWPFVNVRVFTYLIGREASNVREIKWMACANLGYYVHLSTYAEVREEVLQYIPVMARPMVLNSNQKPNPTWSPVYADVTDPKLTNWLWINRERNRQRQRFLSFERKRNHMSPEEQDKKFVFQQKPEEENYGELQVYRLMTSVSLPVYDRKPRAERVANLLGVTGTDIPIEYIQTLMLPHRLGVNGYAFIVSNNGYILTHPDLRPVQDGILKPAYNRVDVTEIEVVDDETEPREFCDEMRLFREKIVLQDEGNITFKVKTHLDSMKRLITSTRHYFYMGVNNTPFSLVIAIPHKYGFNRVQHRVEDDIHRMRVNDKIKGSLTQFFTGNWTIHPDWHYCRYLDDRHYFESPEDEFLHFLKKMDGAGGWKWSGECERKLFSKVVADAKITTWFSQNITNSTKDENGAQFVRRFGITVAFLSTHSGLTRWKEFPQNVDANTKEDTTFRHFHILHNKAIDEVWYRRAVEYHFIEPTSYLYSVPFNIGDENNTLVTVSHAIFREDGGKKAPAAVIGYQSYHTALYSLFRSITKSCWGITCKRTCESDELDCLLLDDNGYIIISDNLEETGYFFGKVRPDIMNSLIEEGVYKVTRMFDYQGLCAKQQEINNPGSLISFPLHHLSNVFSLVVSTVLFLTNSVFGNNLETVLYSEPDNHEEHFEQESETADIPTSKGNEKDFYERHLIPKTKPEPCDYEMWLYNLVHYSEKNMSNSPYNRTMEGCGRPYIVQKVMGSNMILLVVNRLCAEDDSKYCKTPDPLEVNYNMSLACYMVLHNDFLRRHYMSCINKNANESEIKLCGGAQKTSASLTFSISLFILVTYLSKIF